MNECKHVGHTKWRKRRRKTVNGMTCVTLKKKN